MDFSEIVEAEGHLVDSQILANIMDRVIECGAIYEVQDFSLGRTNEEFSKLRLRVIAPSREVLAKTLEELVELGCYQAHIRDAVLKPAPLDCVVPDDFYSTTNHRTFVRIDSNWIEVGNQRMDGVIVIRQEEAGVTATCRKLRDIRQGDQIVSGAQGIRIQPEFKARDRMGFAFMANEISSERRAETAVRKVAQLMRMIKAEGGRIVFVAGPVVIHTGGTAPSHRLSARGTSMPCSRAMRSPCTTSSTPSTAPRSGSISSGASRSKRATRTTCGPSIRSIATGRSRGRSRRASCDPG